MFDITINKKVLLFVCTNDPYRRLLQRDRPLLHVLPVLGLNRTHVPESSDTSLS